MYRIVNRRKRAATRAADTLGHALWALPRLFSRQKPLDPSRVRSILVIRTAYVGDVVMTLPLLAPLKARFPRARIAFLTAPHAAPLLSTNPFVDTVFTHAPFWFYDTSPRDLLPFLRELRRHSFDLVIEARGDIRDIALLARPLGAEHTISYAVGGGGFLLSHTVPHPTVKHRVPYHLDIARFLGARVEDAPVEWGVYLTEGEQVKAEAFLKGEGVFGNFIALHPGARLPLKRWHPHRYAQTCDSLRDRTGLPVVLLGSPGEREWAALICRAMKGPVVNVCGRLNLRELAAVISRAALLVCNDSAPMHLGACCGVPVTALFGPSKPEQTGPWGVPSVIVASPVPCRRDCDESTCTHGVHHACLERVTCDDLVQGALSLL